MAKFNISSKRKIYNSFTPNLKPYPFLSHYHFTKIKFINVKIWQIYRLELLKFHNF